MFADGGVSKGVWSWVVVEVVLLRLGAAAVWSLGLFLSRAFPVPTQPLGQLTMLQGLLGSSCMYRQFKHLIGSEDPALH